MARITWRYLLASLTCGAAWGLVAWLFWPARRTAPDPGFAVALSPLIGLVVGAGFVGIHRLGKAGRIVVSLLSLYVAAALFGMCIGLDRWTEQRHAASSVAGEAVIEDMLATLWGLTFMFFWVLMWPLAYFTHQWLRRFVRRS